jgi:hypothetical protein
MALGSEEGSVFEVACWEYAEDMTKFRSRWEDCMTHGVQRGFWVRTQRLL